MPPPAPARRSVALAMAPLPTRHGGFRPSLGRLALLLLLTLQPALAAVAPRPGGGLPGGAPSQAPPTGAVVGAAPPATPPATAPGPMGNAELRALLRHGDLEGLALGCERALAEERYDRLRLLRQRLLTLHPAPQPLPVVLANADVLLGCQQPEAALTVLERISPAAGAERVQWLLLEWRAAYAALDHRRAAFALERLTASRPERLDLLQLPVARRPDGSVVSRPALDLLAEHQRARGFPEAAAALLLASREPGAVGAERRLDAVRALAQLPAQEREALLESALDQAAAAGAWGLVAELLDAQAALPSERARQRRLRLSPRIDDAYGEWLLRRQEPLPSARQRQLERQLRAPVPLQAPAAGSAPTPTAPSPAPR